MSMFVHRHAVVRNDIYIHPSLTALRYHVTVAIGCDRWYTIENSRMPQSIAGREAFIVLARKHTGCSYPEIAAAARRTTHTTLVTAMKRHQTRPHPLAVEAIRKVEAIMAKESVA